MMKKLLISPSWRQKQTESTYALNIMYYKYHTLKLKYPYIQYKLTTYVTKIANWCNAIHAEITVNLFLL